MEKFSKNKEHEFEKNHEEELSLSELMSVEAGSDNDSDEDCLFNTCKTSAKTYTCYSNVSG